MDLSSFDLPKDKELDTTEFDSNLPEEPGMLASAALGAAQGATFGFADEAEALLRSAMSGQLSKNQYESKLLEIRERYKTYEEANPLSTLAGNIAAGTLIPGGAALKGGLTITKGAKLGAAAGALAGLGTSEASLTSGDVSRALEDVATGAVAGGLTGAAIPAGMALYSGLKKAVVTQPLVESNIKILKDASKGILHSGEGKLEEVSSGLLKTGKDVLGSTSQLASKEASRLDRIIDNIDKRAQITGNKENIQPIFDILEKYKKDLLTKQGVSDIAAIEDSLKVASGKGDYENVIRKLKEKVAEAQVVKLKSMKELSENLVDMENKIKNSSALTPDAAYTLKKDYLAKLIKFKELSNDVMSVKAPEMIKETATDVPVGVIDTDYKTFAKASENIKDFSPEKLPNELRHITKEMNANELFDQITSKEGKAARKEIVDTLNSLQLTHATPKEEMLYSASKKRMSDLSKLMEGAKLDVFYNTTGSGGEVSDVRKMYDIIKQYDKPGSKEGVFFKDFISKLKEISPTTADKIQADVAKASQDFRLSAEHFAPKAFPETGLKFFIPSGRALAAGASETVGKGFYNTEKFLSGVKKLPNRLFSSIDKDNSALIRQAADKLRGSTDKTSIDLLGKLDKIVTMSPNKQKATIFALMQQPQWRETFSALVPDLDNNGE